MANRVYEVMYIVDTEAGEERIAEINKSVGELIEKEGGTVVRLEDIGRRRLAYEINKKSEGHYVLFEIEGSGSEIAELERRMRVNDQIIRYLTVRVDEDRKKADKIQAKRDSRAAKRSKFRKTEESESEQEAAEA